MMSKRFLKRYPLAIVTDIKSFKGALFCHTVSSLVTGYSTLRGTRTPP